MKPGEAILLAAKKQAEGEIRRRPGLGRGSRRGRRILRRMGVPAIIGVLFAPCAFFLLKYRQNIFSLNLHKQEKKLCIIYYI